MLDNYYSKMQQSKWSEKRICDRVDNADKLREVVLSDLMEKQSPSNAALAYIKMKWVWCGKTLYSHKNAQIH
jgi:hypothetical protein